MSDDAMSVDSLWDDTQRDILAALGHSPMMLAPRELPDDPLLHALLRAVGRDAHSHDLDAVLRVLPATSALRGSASAKRTAWPQLRGLRGRSP
jgi:hypothetical protein